MRLLCGEEAEGARGSLFLLFPGASPSHSAVASCPGASPAPACSQGKSAILRRLSSIVAVSPPLKALKTSQAGFSVFLFSSMDSGSLKRGSDENAYLAFRIKVTAGEEKQRCEVQWNTLQPPSSAPSALKHADKRNTFRPCFRNFLHTWPQQPSFLTS